MSSALDSVAQQQIVLEKETMKHANNAHKAWRGFSSGCSPTGKLVLGGSFLLLMLSIVPAWNAWSLVQDFNYVFWAGRAVPHNILLVLLLFVPFFALLSTIFFARTRGSAVLTEQTIMLVATTFITLFGLFLLVSSVPLTRQADVTTNNLLYNCKYSPQTHRLYEYSQVLQNIRATPECALKVSVEQCAGYEESAPYTGFLKELEDRLKCAGFCYESHVTPLTATSLLAETRHTDHVMPLSLTAVASATAMRAGKTYPPTLFSDANYQASCESMAARDMKNYAGDIGTSMYYQGMYLVIISVATGFLKLLGYCIRMPGHKYGVQ